MIQRKTVLTHPTLPSIGPYSFGVKVGDLIFLSGQLGLDPTTNMLVLGGVEYQLRQIFKNVMEGLAAQELTLANIVKITVYMTDLSAFSVVNKVFTELLAEPYPARTTIEVSKLPLGAVIELDFIVS